MREVGCLGVIWDPAGPTAASRIGEIERAAGKRAEDLAGVIETLGQGNIDGVIVDDDLTLLRYNPRIAETARTHRIPLVSPWRPFAETGGAVLAFGPSLPEGYRLAAVYVDQIARGAKPASLPVQRVAKYDLIINLKTARALGLTIPPSLLLRADQVIE